MWLRLKMLQDAGNPGPKPARKSFQRSRSGATTCNREVEDRDFFVNIQLRRPPSLKVIPHQSIEAPEYDRLRVAEELAQSPDLDLREGWSAFCRSDPQRAFDSLCKGDVTAANAALWNAFLHGLASGSEGSKEVRDNLSVRAFDQLSSVDAEILRPMLSGLSDLIRFGPRQRLADVDGWLERLWKLVSEQPESILDLSSDLYDRAIGLQPED